MIIPKYISINVVHDDITLVVSLMKGMMSKTDWHNLPLSLIRNINCLR